MQLKMSGIEQEWTKNLLQPNVLPMSKNLPEQLRLKKRKRKNRHERRPECVNNLREIAVSVLEEQQGLLKKPKTKKLRPS